MRKTAKIIAVLTAAMITVSLTACSGGNAASTTAAFQTTVGTGVIEAETEKKEEVSGDDSLQKVIEAGKIRAGAEGNWNPFVYNDMNDNGKLKGYDVEIVEEIARRMGVEVEWSIASKWDGVIAGLQADRYDVVFCGVTKANLASGADLIGTIAYREDPIVLVVSDENTEIKGWEDLQGKLSGNALTGDYGAIARSYGAELTDASLDQSMELLQQKRIDCHVNSQIAFNTYMREKPDAKVHIVDIYVPEDPTDSEIYGMLTSNKTALRDKMNEVLQEMLDDGYCKELAVKYFGQEVADNIHVYK
ncbi:MAG: transporter substrate-binding domain-containing protein [Lachnospiraceae bacterium]|jgi:cystine transport system substrate-binding protein|nr:transporter substrate-binding domain-containing protein [Lachnospiraceae bacterium]MCI9590726.1 transporter substrate-binding domain-containing protein [Lachnospiraceae bacterium]MDE6930219.1 transporter substrate-binding domain-containing protein [Lachnospiraceae bacterium]